MTNVIFNSGFIGFLICVLLFAVSTAALQIAIRCVWGLHKTIFAMAEFKEQLIPFLFLAFALMVSLLPLRVQAALPKELPTAPAKFLTGACLTWSEDLWITAEAGGVYRLSGQEKNPKWEDMRNLKKSLILKVLLYRPFLLGLSQAQLQAFLDVF